MSASILLARHAHHNEIGRILSGRSEIALSAEGRVQAHRLAEKLVERGIRAIHSSPRLRTLQTAQAVAERLRIPIEQAASLDEIDFGLWMGRSFADLETDPDWQAWNRARADVVPPMGESMSQAIARAANYLENLRSGPGPVLCFSHADVIRGLAVHYLCAPMQSMLRTEISPASVSEFAFDEDGGVRLISLNERLQ